MFQGRQPTNAEIAALLGLNRAGPAPSMGRPQFSFPTPRFVPTGSIQATPKTLSGSIQATIAKGLQKAGISERGANRFATRAMLPLTDATPVGNATGAEEGGKQFYRGLTKGDIGQMAMGAGVFGLSVAPLPGGVKRAGKKLGTGMFGSLLKDKSGAIRAWHGSPHDFDKFEWSPRTRGTGEGAQAYGDGLYFAENPEVAKGYQTALSGTRIVDGRGVPINGREFEITDEIEKAALAAGYDRDRAGSVATGWGHYIFNNRPNEADPVVQSVIKRHGLRSSGDGRLYEVNINAEPEDFLDWDADVTGKVAETIRGLGIEPSVADRWYPMPRYEANEVRRWHNNGAEVAETANGFIAGHNGKAIGTFPTLEDAQAAVPIVRQPLLGSQTYQRLGGSLDGLTAPRGWKQEATDKLLGAGIPGIRYLDQGSRNAANGTRNYVVFDDSLIDILGKY